MKPQRADYQETPYPNARRWRAAAYRSVQHKTMIHGLVEVDVTRARTAFRDYKAKTGKSLSFTAFLIACLAKAVEADKAVQAMRKGRKRLVIFEDVDVWTPMERDTGGQKRLMAHIVRAANRKSFRAIHDEIRATQAADVKHARKGPLALPVGLAGPYMRLFWRLGRALPRFQKRNAGTVGLTAVGMFAEGAGWGIPPPIPTALMLTVGGIGEKQVIVNGQMTVREYLSLTVSVDHDVVDGAPAARFVRRLLQLIESGYGLGDLGVESRQHALTEVYQ